MAAPSFQELSSLYAEERPKYKTAATQLGGRIKDALERRGLEVVVQWRAKTVPSFVKKALREGYENPMQQVGDKAGIRVIVHYTADVPDVLDEIRTLCRVDGQESKRDALAYDQLGYLGVHLDVVLDERSINEADREALVGLPAEVQIHTKAESAWAVVSHELLYKSPHELSVDLQRGITRLVALVELFDAEVARFRKAIESDPDFAELRILVALDDAILRFTARRPDRAISAIIVPPVVRLYDIGVDDIFPAIIGPFVEEHQHRLDRLYAEYRDDERANPILFQPESLLLLERIANDPYRLREAWPADRLPVDLLESLSNIWGDDL